jgi:hypothetical protein
MIVASAIGPETAGYHDIRRIHHEENLVNRRDAKQDL